MDEKPTAPPLPYRKSAPGAALGAVLSNVTGGSRVGIGGGVGTALGIGASDVLSNQRRNA